MREDGSKIARVLEYINKQNSTVTMEEVRKACKLSSSTTSTCLWSLAKNGHILKHSRKGLGREYVTKSKFVYSRKGIVPSSVFNPQRVTEPQAPESIKLRNRAREASQTAVALREFADRLETKAQDALTVADLIEDIECDLNEAYKLLGDV
jgi:hypothetical protein